MNVRRAISYAINREQALDALRGGLGRNVHHILTGPFPTGSWACGPTPVQFSFDKARSSLTRAKEMDGVKDLALSVKYPDNDPAVAKAMKTVCDQVSKELGIVLTPQAVAPHALQEQVEGSYDYDLAYYHYDFPSEAYWLWPLFDNPQEGEPRGSNYLGYSNADLQHYFGEIMAHCDFQQVQKNTHDLSDELCNKVPIIPLWQLDRHIALTNDLKTVPFDPLLIFSDVDQWRLEKK